MTPEQVKQRLESAYSDGNVAVIDLTGTHDHYQVTVESKKFAGKTRIQQHKDVMAVFDAELRSGEVHALTIRTVIKD